MPILKLLRGTTVLPYEIAAKQQEKNEHKVGLKTYCKNELQVGMSL